MMRNDCFPGDIHVDHVSIVQKVDLIKRHSQVSPVDTEYIYCLLREFECFKDSERIIPTCPEHVREMFLHVFRVIRCTVIHVDNSRTDLFHKVEQSVHLIPCSGNIFFHFVNESFSPCRHGDIHRCPI